MGSLSLLLLATPLFGLSLNAPDPALLAPIAVMAPIVAQLDVDANVEADADLDGSEGDTEADADDAEGPASDVAPGAESGEDSYEAQMKRRNSIASLHRTLGIATWAAMTATVATGVFQYYNQYGFFADQAHNPCVTGDAIFDSSMCTGTPWYHAVSAGVTTGLYGTTFALSLMMPDPDNLSEGKGEFANTLRIHKALRWVHFGGMVAQALLGIVIANSELIGLDRANDYDTLQVLASVHMYTGLITYGALTWAGALMTF